MSSEQQLSVTSLQQVQFTVETCRMQPGQRHKEEKNDDIKRESVALNKLQGIQGISLRPP